MAQPTLLANLELKMLAYLAHVRLRLESQEPANEDAIEAYEDASQDALFYIKRDGYPINIFADD